MGPERNHDAPGAGKRLADRLDMLERVRRAARGDARVVDAFRAVPRELFVPQELADAAYEDRALPLEEGQTISQPSMIAIMLAALEVHSTCRVLEVGTGCGYAAALLAHLASEVHGIERLPALAALARRNLARAGIGGVTVHLGDGCLGLPEHAPFDRILVSAGASAVPPALLDQLAIGGVIAIPVDALAGQILQVGRRGASGQTTFEPSVACSFVPLITQSRRSGS